MKVNYSLRESEYSEFVSDVTANQFKKYKKWVIGFIALYLLVNCAYARHWSDLISVFLPVILFVSIWFYLLRSGTGASRILKNEKHRQLILGNQSVELLEDKIIFTTESAITQLNWNSISAFKEIEKSIYLGVNQATYIIIPKRVFENEASFTHFKQIVERNMPSK